MIRVVSRAEQQPTRKNGLFDNFLFLKLETTNQHVETTADSFYGAPYWREIRWEVSRISGYGNIDSDFYNSFFKKAKNLRLKKSRLFELKTKPAFELVPK